MIKRFLLGFLSGFLNLLTPKVKYSFFISTGVSSKNNCEDIINNGGNNSLCFAYNLIQKRFDKKVSVFIVYMDDSRASQYIDLIQNAKKNNISLKFIRGHADKRGISRFFCFLREYHFMHKCMWWIVGTGDARLFGKLPCQKIINLNYFISCKNDLIIGKNDRWKYLDAVVTTSLLGSTVISSQTGVKLDRCLELGFPRNDTLFCKEKQANIINWIEKEIGYRPSKIIVYAPTYRDYEKKSKIDSNRFLFGYDIPELESFLLENQICLISKLHNLTKKETIILPKGVIPFKICYEFTFYDLLAITDCLITDYSSVGYDFLLVNRPIIYNLYDLEKYIEDRGLSYEPYDEFCPGAVVNNSFEMMEELTNFVQGIDHYKEKRIRLSRIFHKNMDKLSSERIISYFCYNYGLKKADDKKTDK